MPAQTATIDDFVIQLIDDKKFENLDDETRKTIHEELVGRVKDTIIANTIASLTDADVEEFNKLLDTNPPEEKIEEFIAGKIPDGAQFIARTLVQFRQNYLGHI